MSAVSFVRIPAHVRAVIDPDGAVVLDVKKGSYYSLNSIGVEVWTRLEAGMSLTDIERAIASDFDAPTEVVARDVQRFVAKLHEKSLVEVVDSPSPP